MHKQSIKLKFKFAHVLSFAIIGFALGWILGLSQAPIISDTIGHILVLIITLVTIFSGLEPKVVETKLENIISLKVNPIPVAVFMLFLSIGIGVGIFTRTHQLLSPDDITNNDDSVIQQTVLFNIESSICDELCRYEGSELIEVIENLDDLELRNQLLTYKNNLGKLQKIISQECQDCE